MTKSTDAIRNTVLDYFEGWFEGDIVRMDRALHPDLVKRTPAPSLGATTKDRMLELTALGDTVNTAARLASIAAAGEILVTTPAAEAAGLESTLERRSLDLKGKGRPTDVVVLRV